MALRFPDIGFVFTSDGALTDDLVEFARDASCLLCEATYPTADGHNLKQHGHMTASQAGELAARANVIQLVVTHLSRESDSTSTLHAAHAAFQKEALLAYPGLSVTIAQRALSAPQSGRLWP
jgi:ribonuclease Z